jgi:GH18 family chitinase
MLITIEGLRIQVGRIEMTQDAAAELLEELKTMLDEAKVRDGHKAMLVTTHGTFNLHILPKGTA